MKKSRKRLIRYSIVTVNFVLLFAVVIFVVHNSASGDSLQHSSANSTGAPVNPLDQVSSADIADNLARMTNLAETDAVTNYADSFNAQETIAADTTTVVSKPQVITASAKSRKDIQVYTTVQGDTISSLAAKFGVTSDSIRDTNELTGDAVAVNVKLTIPPVNGIVYTVKAGDTVATLAKKYSANEGAITDINDAEVAGIKVGEQIIIPDAVKPRPVTRYVAPSDNTPDYGYPFGNTALYNGVNGYAYGWCTYGAALWRAQHGNPVPSNLGNAATWYKLAQRAGLPTGSVPQVGAVAVNQSGNHVMIVVQVNDDGSFWIWEMNGYGQRSLEDTTPAGGWNKTDVRMFKSVGNLKFIY